MEKFTVTQRERLAELDAAPDILAMEFDTTEARNAEFRKIETSLAKAARERLKDLVEDRKITFTEEVSRKLQDWLIRDGYTKVSTPTIITRQMLEKMTIDEFHHLSEQVFLAGQKTLPASDARAKPVCYDARTKENHE